MLAANPFLLCTAPTNQKGDALEKLERARRRANRTGGWERKEHVDIITNRHALSTLPRA
jgi:hypothetical protein